MVACHPARRSAAELPADLLKTPLSAQRRGLTPRAVLGLWQREWFDARGALRQLRGGVLQGGVLHGT